MNERIKELAEQAVLQANEVFDQKGKDYPGIVMEKFAELIVRECVNQIEAEHTEALDNHIEDWDRGYLGGLRVAKEIIQKHFGVDYFGDE